MTSLCRPTQGGPRLRVPPLPGPKPRLGGGRVEVAVPGVPGKCLHIYISTYLHVCTMYLQTGTVHYLPHTEHSDEVQLPGIDEPVPDTWKTVQVGDSAKCTCDSAEFHL